MKRYYEDQSRREDLSQAQRRYYEDPAVRARRAEQARRQYDDPEQRAALLEGNHRYFADPENRRKHGEQTRQRFASAEARATHSRRRRPIGPEGQPMIYNLISPDGVIYRDIENLSEFCKAHGLNQGNISGVLHGKVLHHKGWRRFDEEFEE